jgi:hypothetical protein
MARLDVALIKSGEEIGLKIGLAPIRVPAGGTFARPGMPQEVILRFDMGAPPLKVLPWLEEAAREIGPGGAAAAKAPAGQAGLPGDLAHNIAEVMLAGQAASLGIAPRDNFAVFYMVQQHVGSDPAARFKQIAEQSDLAAAYTTDKKHATRLDFSQYATPTGIHVARLRLMENQTCKFCVDAVRRGDSVFLAGSTDQGRYLASLLEEKPQGTFSGLLNGSLSLGAALSIVEDAAGKNAIPPELAKKLHDMLHGQFLTLSATGEPDEVVVGVSVQKELVKQLIETFYAPTKK